MRVTADVLPVYEEQTRERIARFCVSLQRTLNSEDNWCDIIERQSEAVEIFDAGLHFSEHRSMKEDAPSVPHLGDTTALNDDLADLIAKPPSQRAIVPLEKPTYPVLFAARWPAELFGSHDEFLDFTSRFDSELQAFIQGIYDDDLRESFVPQADNAMTPARDAIAPARVEDAVDWVKRIFPFAVIPWLSRGDHTQILDEHQDRFGDLTAFGPAGYMVVFAADLV